MRVIHFIPSLDRTAGGTSFYMQLLANELGKQCDLYIVTEKTENPLDINNAIIKCWLPQCAWLQLWAQKLGYKVVLTPHGMLEPWIIKRHYWSKKIPALFFYQYDAVRKADIIHATANSERNNLLKLGYNKNVHVIVNGIDVDNIVMKQTWNRKKKILFLSRIHVKKGIAFLIKAVAVLKEQLQDYTVNIVGEGDSNYVEELKALTVSLGVDNIVCFLGAIYEDEKWDMFRESDLFILPTYSENFGIVVVEALACGTPVLTTKGTPWKDLETYKCGWWVEVGTESIVESIQKFLTLSIEELKVMGNNGRKLVENSYSSSIMATDMMQMYRELM